MGRYLQLLSLAILLNSLEAASQLHLKGKTDSSALTIRISPMPQKFYNPTFSLMVPGTDHNLGFFCRKELQLQRVTNIPLFIRLGSKSYVDWLERKPNATGKN
ncbi:MAG: hypothetical protein ACXWB9_04350 [Flavisolibacter sp.]